MKVREAVQWLSEHEDQDAVLAICAHGFPGLEGQAWPVRELVAASGDTEGIVLIEGAGPQGDQ